MSKVFWVFVLAAGVALGVAAWRVGVDDDAKAPTPSSAGPVSLDGPPEAPAAPATTDRVLSERTRIEPLPPRVPAPAVEDNPIEIPSAQAAWSEPQPEPPSVCEAAPAVAAPVAPVDAAPAFSTPHHRRRRPRLAVIPLTILGDVSAWHADAGPILADAMVAEIDTLRYEVCERTRVAALLAEKGFQASALADSPDRAASFGRLAGVRYLVLGTLGRLGSRYHLSARVVDCSQGRVGGRGWVTFASIDRWTEKIPELVNLIGLRAGADSPDVPASSAPASPDALMDAVNPAASFGLTLRTVDGRRSYAEGEFIQFELRAERDCFVTLITADPAGAKTLLLPNRWRRRAFVPRGRSVRIPSEEMNFRFPIQPPHGQTRVKAIATLQPLKLSGVTEARIMAETFVALPPGVKAIGVAGDPSAPAPPSGDLHDLLRSGQWATAELAVMTYDPRDGRPRSAAPKPSPSVRRPRPFHMGGSGGEVGPNERVMAVWRTLRQGRLAPPASLLTAAQPARRRRRELVVFRRGSRRGERITVTTSDLAHRLGAFSADPSIAGVAENIRVCSFGLPPTKLAGVQWALKNDFASGEDIRWSRAVVGADGRAVPIGLVDASVDFGDQRLARAAWRNRAERPDNGVDDDNDGFVDDVHGYDFIADSGRLAGSPSTFHHGSFVASIIAGRPAGGDDDVVGVCSQAKIIAAVALAPDRPAANPWRAAGDLARVIDALRYVVDRGAKVVNMSFGAAVTAKQLEQINRLPIWDDLERRGVILVCAAGNEHVDLDCRPVFPACLPRSNVLTVMAVDVAGRLGRAQDPRTGRWTTFTNYGARSVDLAAPGTLILGASRRGDVELLSGTSYSAAITTAAAAMVWGRHPRWDGQRVIKAVCRAARSLESLQGRCRTGGVLNLAEALRRR